MNREIVVPLSDLAHLSLECPSCHTVIILPVEAELKAAGCPSCGTPFDATVRGNVTALIGAVSRMRESKYSYAFRIADNH